MVDKAAQAVDFKRREQPPFLRRVEQGKGFLRLLGRDYPYVPRGVHAVPHGCIRGGMPGVAGGEQDDCRKQDDRVDT